MTRRPWRCLSRRRRAVAWRLVGRPACNDKPNYNSVMNYRFQFGGTDTDCDAQSDSGFGSYSLGALITLNENALDESAGVCGTAPIDWNGENGLEPSVSVDINGAEQLQTQRCGAVISLLTDHSDWGLVASTIATGPSSGTAGGALISSLITCDAVPAELLQK